MKGKEVKLKIAADIDKKLKGQMKGLVGGLDSTTKAMRSLENQQRQLKKLASLDKAMAKTNKEYTEAAKHYDKLKKLRVKGTEEEKAKQRQDLAAAKARMDVLKKESSDQIKAFEKYKQGLTKLKVPLDDYNKSLADIEKQSNKLAKQKKWYEGLGKAKNNLKKLGATILKTAKIGVVAGAAMASAFAFDAGRTYLDFNQNMKRVQAISGATAADFKTLENAAIKFGSTSKFTSSETAKGMEYLALAGFETNEILEAMPGLLSLAAASGEELGSVSDIVSDNLSAFNLEADKAGHLADVLAKASSTTNTTVGMLGEAFKYAAAPAAALGGSVEEVSAMLGIMADSGIKASQAGTTLRSAYLNLAKPTDAMQDSINKLGLSLNDENGNFIGMSKVVNQLQDSFEGMTDTQKAAHLTTLFGKTAVSGMMSVIATAPGKLDEMTKSFENSEGAAQKMADTMLEGPAGAIELLKSSYDGLKVVFGRALFTPQVIEGIRLVTGYLSGLASAMAGDFSTPEALLFEKPIEMFQQFIELVKEVSLRVFDFFTNIIPSNAGEFLEPLIENFKVIVGLVKALFGLLVSLQPVFRVLLNLFLKVATFISKIFRGIGKLATGVINLVTKLVELITGGLSKLKLPKWVTALASKYKGSDDGLDGSHKTGLANVPHDGYIAELHKGERVLTASENKGYRGSLGTRVQDLQSKSVNSVTNQSNRSFVYEDNRTINITGSSSSTVEDLKKMLDEDRDGIVNAVLRAIRESNEDMERVSYGI